MTSSISKTMFVLTNTTTYERSRSDDVYDVMSIKKRQRDVCINMMPGEAETNMSKSQRHKTLVSWNDTLNFTHDYSLYENIYLVQHDLGEYYS